MSPPTIADSLCDPARPSFLFGCTPPREGTSDDKAELSCRRFAARSAVLATDGFIVYDIQDEAGRTEMPRPFPFRKTLDPSWYASLFPKYSGKQCVVYKCVVEHDGDAFDQWVSDAMEKHGHCAFNLVGAPSSKGTYSGLTMHEAADVLNRHSAGGAAHVRPKFGCVAIAERHSKKGNEHHNMMRKAKFGAEWFISQGIFAAGPMIKLLHDYGDLCRAEGVQPKKVVLTFAPCGRAKTMTFIKWLGMHVPEDVEARILGATNTQLQRGGSFSGSGGPGTTPTRDFGPVNESCQILCETLRAVLEGSAGSGVPLGVNVESLSIFREEIDAAHSLFRSLQEIMLIHTGRHWAIRWYFVPCASGDEEGQAAENAVATMSSNA